ncbi:MAG: 4-hydroxythreonine-4-phosphate dehydrogenase PdxA [Candidatus Brocadiia bacterium]
MRNSSPTGSRRIAVTLGDPGGIGPEVVVRALADDSLRMSSKWVLIGPEKAFRRALRGTKVELSYTVYSKVLPDIGDSEEIVLLDPSLAEPIPELGASSRNGGLWAATSIECAVDLALRGVAQALTTAPISKTNLAASGRNYPGHTEMLAALCGVKYPLMLLVSGSMRVALFTRHISLRSVFRNLKQRSLIDTIELVSRELGVEFGISNPRIAVLALNPHCGEGGLFGVEEIRVIGPAVAKAASRGISAFGPISADTAFTPESLARCDCILAMYHDQGLGPFKALAFQHGVNVTLNLPFPRTSPDHGTAFDRAPRFSADPTSMRDALRLAISFVEGK